jgi:hypothetical protein
LDVQVNGNQATPAQLATLIDAIDGDGFTPASLDVSASTVSPTGAFPSDYNLFLGFSQGFGKSVGEPLVFGAGFDLSNSNDPNLVGYSFSAVAASVPEPMSSGLLLGAGVILASRRRRRAST